jgi:hypothetical protein
VGPWPSLALFLVVASEVRFQDLKLAPVPDVRESWFMYGVDHASSVLGFKGKQRSEVDVGGVDVR